jgi:hypothetical protein
MKKLSIIILCCVALSLSSSSTMADPFEMDRDTAALLDAVSWTDAGSMYYIGYNPGGTADRIAYTDPAYGANMKYSVGFSGRLFIDPTINDTLNDPSDQFASVNIGLNGAKVLTGTYDSFVMSISNDDNQTWEYKLYANTTGNNYLSSSWTSLASGDTATLTLDFGTDVDFATLKDIGLIIQFNKATTGGGTNFSDDFHTSVVPVPGAVLLGLLGLSIAGVKLRKFT